MSRDQRMGRKGRKPPLFRKVNTRARNHRHNTGGDFRHERNTKPHDKANWEDAPQKTSMLTDGRRGLDYAPLFRFLLSKVGQPWVPVHSEAISRLDRPDPISWMVINLGHSFELGRNVSWSHLPDEVHSYFGAGESTYWSTLYVDGEGILRKVDPEYRVEDLVPSCYCCTHTFNGAVTTRNPK